MKISGSHEGVYVNFAIKKGGLRKISEFIAISTPPPPANIKWTFPRIDGGRGGAVKLSLTGLGLKIILGTFNVVP